MNYGLQSTCMHAKFFFFNLFILFYFMKNKYCVCVCVCVCVCRHVYVVYEDTNLYNDMGIT